MGNGLNQAMTAVLCLAWVIIYYSMMNGSEQAGAKLYFVAMCPYVILTIFLGMGLRSGCKNVDLEVNETNLGWDKGEVNCENEYLYPI